MGVGDATRLVPGTGSKMVKGSSLSAETGNRWTGDVVGDGYRSSGVLPLEPTGDGGYDTWALSAAANATSGRGLAWNQIGDKG